MTERPRNPVPVRALSTKQPWANFIAIGSKTIETRTWSTPYRGKLLNVASKGVDRLAMQIQGAQDGPLGMAISVAELVDVRPMTLRDEYHAMCPYRPGLYAWVLRESKIIVPFKVLGRLGLFTVDVPAEYLR